MYKFDKNRVQQIFINLLSNAVKFSFNYSKVTIKIKIFPSDAPKEKIIML